MAKKIIWTIDAKNDRRKILEYWHQKTGNKNYSRKLSQQFRQTVRYIAKHNYLGRATDIENVRVTVCGHYLLFYKLNKDNIEIATLFDNRRNPEDLKLK